MQGVTIPAGSIVNISLGSANNDPEVFRDPRRFDLRRDDLWLAKELRRGYHDGRRFGHLGFGLGKHFCLGYEMARAEAVIGSRMLLDARRCRHGRHPGRRQVCPSSSRLPRSRPPGRHNGGPSAVPGVPRSNEP